MKNDSENSRTPQAYDYRQFYLICSTPITAYTILTSSCSYAKLFLVTRILEIYIKVKQYDWYYVYHLLTVVVYVYLSPKSTVFQKKRNESY